MAFMCALCTPSENGAVSLSVNTELVFLLSTGSFVFSSAERKAEVVMTFKPCVFQTSFFLLVCFYLDQVNFYTSLMVKPFIFLDCFEHQVVKVHLLHKNPTQSSLG